MPDDRAFHALRVAAIDRLTEDSVALTFDVPPDLRPEYRRTHGQYVTLRSPLTGDDVGRDYSLCTPVSAGDLRVAVKRLTDGAFSQYAVDRLRVGDEIEVSTPAGNFHTPLDPRAQRHYVCIAAGSGITPVMSIIPTVLETETTSSVTLLYSNRTRRSTMFAAEIADLERQYPDRLTVHHILTREDAGDPMLSGRLDASRMEWLLDDLLAPETVDEWFLCGPFSMVVTLRKVLVQHGVAKRRLHAEVFHID